MSSETCPIEELATENTLMSSMIRKKMVSESLHKEGFQMTNHSKTCLLKRIFVHLIPGSTFGDSILKQQKVPLFPHSIYPLSPPLPSNLLHTRKVSHPLLCNDVLRNLGILSNITVTNGSFEMSKTIDTILCQI